MGRHKPGKPGRTPLPGLRGMHPPGELYERWYRVYDIGLSDVDRRHLDSLGPHQAADAVKLAGLYSDHVPNAAIALAALVRAGRYPLHTLDGPLVVTGEEVAARLASAEAPPGLADVGRLLHRMHALGLVLVTVQRSEGRTVPLLRFTRSTPALGGRWTWVDEFAPPAEMPWLSPADVYELRAAEEAAVRDGITGGATGAQAEHLLARSVAEFMHQAGCVPAGVCTC
ncbi:hypothetical protein ACFWA9_29160 [Kitasatospora sp. NPDC059973]|uniref:hypothetical protein n=1 Tax=Kitasatospora sp. NPDC059973 TaxID=3347020 RepID=UPI0036CE2821